MQSSSIIEKAQRLGLDTSGVNQNDILQHIAEQVGVEDLDELNQTLDDMLSEGDVDALSNTDELQDENFDNINNEVKNEKFGQKEYNQAKNEDGIYDKNHYKNKQNELEKKLEDAKNERKTTNKKVGIDENGHNKYKNKNVLDKAKDKRNVAKARQDSITNKLNHAKASAYNMMHPGEALKDKAKNTAKNVAKDSGKKVAKGAAKAGKAAIKATISGIKAFIAFIASNPIILIIFGVVLIILFIIILFFGGGDSNGDVNRYCDSNCDGLSMKQTSLSKMEFVTKVKEYFSNATESYKITFANNASIIYDVAKSEGVNPEIVVIRAIHEGFSPERDCGSTYYNYWGMGCYNGQGCAPCIKYSSFEDGVRGFVQNISKYETATDWMSKYSYIGKYWYNPGGAGIGGCYYYELIKENMSSSRANTVGRVCNSNKECTISGGSNCLETTDEDQEAYTTYQIKGMLSTRERVFGISADQCNKTCYKGEQSINPDDEKYSGLQLLHDKSFDTLLAENGSSIEKYNEYLKSEIEKAGVGTREGVVAAATSLIGSIAEMGYKLNYQWGGKYYKIGVNPNWGLPGYTDCGDYAGRGYTKSKCTTNYRWSSFDCSGFVNWALINGTQNPSTPTQYTNSSGIGLSSSEAVCKIGGVLVSRGHIVLVVGIDDETKNYIVAESTGSDISTNSGGVKLSYKPYDASGYVCRNLNDIYGD